MSSLPLIIQVIFWDMYVLLYYFIIFIYDKINSIKLVVTVVILSIVIFLFGLVCV